MARTSHGEGFKIEIDLDNASPKSVWNQISTARGLSEWIAPRVDVSLRKIHVFWDETGDDRSATVTDLKKGESGPRPPHPLSEPYRRADRGSGLPREARAGVQ